MSMLISMSSRRSTKLKFASFNFLALSLMFFPIAKNEWLTRPCALLFFHSWIASQEAAGNSWRAAKLLNKSTMIDLTSMLCRTRVRNVTSISSQPSCSLMCFGQVVVTKFRKVITNLVNFESSNIPSSTDFDISSQSAPGSRRSGPLSCLSPSSSHSMSVP